MTGAEIEPKPLIRTARRQALELLRTVDDILVYHITLFHTVSLRSMLLKKPQNIKYVGTHSLTHTDTHTLIRSYFQLLVSISNKIHSIRHTQPSL